MLNLKFAGNREARFDLKDSHDDDKFCISPHLCVWGVGGIWGVEFIANDNWWELWERPDANEIYLIKWVTPYHGVILDSCKKETERLIKMKDGIIELEIMFDSAMESMIDPIDVAEINLPTAGAGTKRSIKQLANEANFLQQKVSGQSALDCAIRTRSLAVRASRVHKDLIGEIFQAAKKTKEREREKAERNEGVHNSENSIHAGLSKVRSVPPTINGVPSHKGKARSLSRRGVMGGTMPSVSPSSTRKPRVGKETQSPNIRSQRKIKTKTT